ncbi:MAG: hypothetical protein OJF59_001795 [Cytophagales bacterium]|jgi:hypothetical protein|nr:hypothetical protein [Bacteroidota bacterium]MBS1950731.1 hypothetical protein [Bacteroidota bacterium]MBS1980709.1 hypothetical protein [Bacteroidota bacterium]WHZ08042.1 MAG: hypothetical protein OJF59_001795 [Cytophagales bacterium]
MKPENKNKSLSRRTFLGTGLTLPFLSMASPSLAETFIKKEKEDDEFTTMLTADGKAVKVKKNALKDARVIEEKMSNQSLLNWLRPKGFLK